jgi:hypothetical protein
VKSWVDIIVRWSRYKVTDEEIKELLECIECFENFKSGVCVCVCACVCPSMFSNCVLT